MAGYESDLDRKNGDSVSEIDFLKGNVIALAIIIAHIPETKFIDRESVESCLKVIWDRSNNDENIKHGSLSIVENLFEITKFIGK